jgi:hypothetical protein
VRFRPAVTASDFEAMQERLGESAVGRAVQDDRVLSAEQTDRDVADIEKRGEIVVAGASSAFKASRQNPNLAGFILQDQRLAREMEIAEKRADTEWFPSLPWGSNSDIREIAEKRKRLMMAFQRENPDAFGGTYEGETVEEFNARTGAERDRLEQARQQQGLPFGAGILNVRIINPEDVRADVPRPAQEGE